MRWMPASTRNCSTSWRCACRPSWNLLMLYFSKRQSTVLFERSLYLFSATNVYCIREIN
jgi:hypothetical protein